MFKIMSLLNVKQVIMSNATTIIQLAIAGGLFYYITSLQDDKVTDVDITPPKPKDELKHGRFLVPDHLPTSQEWGKFTKNNPQYQPKIDFKNMNIPPGIVWTIPSFKNVKPNQLVDFKFPEIKKFAKM